MNNGQSLKIINITILILIICVVAYFIGMRDLSIGTDTPMYVRLYNAVLSGADTRINEFFFLFLVKVSSALGVGPSGFLYVISFLSILGLLYFYHKSTDLFPEKTTVSTKVFFIVTAFAITMISPFFWNAELNVIRAGLSIPLFLTGALFLYQKKYFASLVFVLFAVLTHYSSLLFVPLLYLLRVKEKTLLIVYILLSLLYVTGISQKIFMIVSQKLYTIDYLTYYLKNALDERGYRAGVRYDFWLFTTFFFYMIYRIRNTSALSDFLFRIYMLLTVPFLFLGYINFSDRLLLAAWNVIPLLGALYMTKYVQTNMYSYAMSILLLLVFSVSSLVFFRLV